MVVLELQEVHLCLLEDFYGSLYRQRETEDKICFGLNSLGFSSLEGGITVECTVINLIQHWKRRRRKDCIGKKKEGVFFNVLDVRSKWQFQ